MATVRGSDRATVLVVDDNEPIADTYASFLDAEYDVTTAYGGEAALERIDPTVDVVLLDRRMPGVSGDEVLDRIDPRALDCRVVMVTAVDPAFDVVDLAFDAYVTKPVSREQLVAVVEEMDERAECDDRLRRFLALASKKAALDREMTVEERRENEAYGQLERQLDEMRSNLGVDTAELEGIFSGDVPDIDAAAIVGSPVSE